MCVLEKGACEKEELPTLTLFYFRPIRNPFDVMKTLAQTNKEASVGLMTLVGNMYKDQGIGGFYRGVQVNVLRACTLNATKMGCYDLAKGYVTEYTGWARKDVRTAFCSAFVAGFFMTVTVVRIVSCSLAGVVDQSVFSLTLTNSFFIANHSHPRTICERVS